VLPTPLQLQLAVVVVIVSCRLIVTACFTVLLPAASRCCLAYASAFIPFMLSASWSCQKFHLLSPHSPPVDCCFFLKVCPCGCRALIDAAAVIVVTTFAIRCLLSQCFPCHCYFCSLLCSKLPLLLLDCCFIFCLHCGHCGCFIHHHPLSVFPPHPTAAVAADWLLRFWQCFLVATC